MTRTGTGLKLGVADELPFIDELDATIEAPSGAVFEAVCRRIGRGFGGAAGRAFTAVIGCANRGNSFTIPPAPGQEVNGFRVARVLEPRELILEGQHRFASYRLSFFIESLDADRSRLRARTEAAFPGITGSLYRGLVIGSGAHAFIVKQMLGSVASMAAPGRAARG